MAQFLLQSHFHSGIQVSDQEWQQWVKGHPTNMAVLKMTSCSSMELHASPSYFPSPQLRVSPVILEPPNKAKSEIFQPPS